MHSPTYAALESAPSQCLGLAGRAVCSGAVLARSFKWIRMLLISTQYTGDRIFQKKKRATSSKHQKQNSFFCHYLCICSVKSWRNLKKSFVVHVALTKHVAKRTKRDKNVLPNSCTKADMPAWDARARVRIWQQSRESNQRRGNFSSMWILFQCCVFHRQRLQQEKCR